VTERIAARALGRLRASGVVAADPDRPAWRLAPPDAEAGRPG
jgi:hypothetical protein